MKAKIEYNPDEPNGQLYYMEFDVMLIFPYEYYKGDAITAINIPLEFDENFLIRRNEILNFIGQEVAFRQKMPSYYKITNTSIEIRKITVSYRLKSLPIKTLSGIALLILGSYMTSKGIILGVEPHDPIIYSRRGGPIPGEIVIIFGALLLINVYLTRKKVNKRIPKY
jgi:hypothetical protein